TVADLRAVAEVAGLPRGRAERVLADIVDVVSGWPALADESGVDEQLAERIAGAHRLALARS
ncbi:MAG: type II toxin-antitoxin system HipA family toxin, partial [Acidobacteriota bacterium]|nr:type II toxin-antitoxin system HipA family toxin [Acidobacteriota bacterium]